MSEQPTTTTPDGSQPDELNPDPASTYGATPEYIAAWFEKYGEKDEDGNVVTGGTEPDKTPAPESQATDQVAPGGGPDSGTAAAADAAGSDAAAANAAAPAGGAAPTSGF